MKKIIVTIVVVLMVIALGIKGKALLKQREAEVKNETLPTAELITAHVVKPIKGELQNKEPYLAQILSKKSIKLSTRVAGFVEKVYVQESQFVKKGDLLVTIDSIDLRSNIDALKATLNAQKSDLALAYSIYKTDKKLYEVGGLAKQRLKMSKVSLNAKEAVVESTTQKLAQANHQLSYLQIRAPFDGEIDTLLLHKGDLAVASKPILALSTKEKKLIFSYAPTKESKIVKGKKVFVDSKEIGFIKTIYTTSKNALSTAEVALTKKIELPAGSNINIEVLIAKEEGCIIPKNTILHKKDGVFVLEYKDKAFVLVEIEVKLQSRDKILISNCPNNPIAQASEVKLANLLAHKEVKIIGENYE